METLELKIRDIGHQMEKKWILIIEDEGEISDMLSDFFKLNGFSTVQAHTEQYALRKMENQRFDIILCDIQLGRSNILPVFKEIKENRNSFNYKVPAIIYSGNITVAIIKEYKSAIKGVVVKPSSMEILLEKIKKLLY